MDERATAGGTGLHWRSLVVFLAFMAIALFFLLSEHRIHVLGWLPLLLLAACPLMHLFMHHGHGHGGHEKGGHGSHEHSRPVDPGAARAEGEI
jgi:hypothetical protein